VDPNESVGSGYGSPQAGVWEVAMAHLGNVARCALAELDGNILGHQTATEGESSKRADFSQELKRIPILRGRFWGARAFSRWTYGRIYCSERGWQATALDPFIKRNDLAGAYGNRRSESPLLVT
jgi:hypothetical protein